jgi:transposase InsO family protein
MPGPSGPRVVAAALEELQLALPFHLAGIHSDNGSEVINHHLLRWCTARQITVTRGRPSRKNDNAHVEQKNSSIIRRCAGYFCYDTAREADLLDRLWATELPVVNLFKPQQELTAETRNGAKVSKTHDTAPRSAHIPGQKPRPRTEPATPPPRLRLPARPTRPHPGIYR